MSRTNSKKGKGKIELTKQQFVTLLKVVYLGNWLANAQRTDDRIKEYEDIESFIFSHAKQFGFPHYVDELVSEGTYFPSGDFEEGTEVDRLHEEYDDDAFWEELIDRLGKRDVIREYGEKAVENMEFVERMMKIEEARQKYEKIFSEEGLDAVEVKKNRE